MADIGNNDNLFYGNLDSEREFEGFDEGDLHIIGEELLPEYEVYQIEGDRDFPSDLPLNWSRNFSLSHNVFYSNKDRNYYFCYI